MTSHRNRDRSNALCMCRRTADHGYAEMVTDLGRENERLRGRLAGAEAFVAELIDDVHETALAENEVLTAGGAS